MPFVELLMCYHYLLCPQRDFWWYSLKATITNKIFLEKLNMGRNLSICLVKVGTIWSRNWISNSFVSGLDCSEPAYDVIISWPTSPDGYEIRKIISLLYSTELNHDSWHTFVFKTRWVLTVWHLPWKINSLWRRKSNDAMRLWSFTRSAESNFICKRWQYEAYAY